MIPPAVQLFAIDSTIWLFDLKQTLEEAELVMSQIGAAYFAPNKISDYSPISRGKVRRILSSHLATPAARSFNSNEPRPNVRLRRGDPSRSMQAFRGLRRVVRHRASCIGDGSWKSLSPTLGWMFTRTRSR